MSNNYSYNSLYRHKLSGQSYTSPILRWTGNSPIWGKITVPTRGSSMYDSPPHTHTTDCSARTTNQNSPPANLVNYSNHTYRHNNRSEENDRPHGRPLYSPHTSRKIYSRNMRNNTVSHTCDRKVTKILDASTPKIDQHAKLNITVNK